MARHDNVLLRQRAIDAVFGELLVRCVVQEVGVRGWFGVPGLPCDTFCDEIPVAPTHQSSIHTTRKRNRQGGGLFTRLTATTTRKRRKRKSR